MKKNLLLLIFIFIVKISFSQTYSITRSLALAEVVTPTTGVTTITTLGDDNTTGALNIGFNFNFYSTTYTQFFIGSNGVISFGSGQAGSYGSAQPTNFGAITFAGTNLNCGTSYSPSAIINYFTTGVSPNRILVVNFKNIKTHSTSSPSNFSNVQIQLYEGSNNIELHVSNVQSSPGSFNRCIGVCNNTSTLFTTQANINGVNTVNVVNEMIRFIPAALPPDINLKGNAVSIVNGDVTPSLTDHTEFGMTDISTGSIVRTFTIENNASPTLTLTGSPVVNITGPNTGDFTVTTVPATTIAGLGSTTFQVTFDPSSAGGKQATISIASNDTDENPYIFAIYGFATTTSASPFVTRWNMLNSGAVSAQLSFGVVTTGTVNYIWQEVGGNNTSGSGTFSGTTAIMTGFPSSGTIDLSIETANFQGININNGGDRSRLIDIKRWGSTNWTSMQNAFYGCNAMNISANDAPNLAGVSNMSGMFRNCSILNSPTNINTWNTATITDMSAMFQSATAFNQNIGSWNTGAITNMLGMFSSTGFNQNIGSWNTAAVINMQGMFSGNYVFNQNIGAWNTAAVTNMSYMFELATSFNQNIGSWNTAAVTNMAYMFRNATAFNQNIGTWNTGAVTNMSKMFESASNFNQNISLWNTASVTDMSSMFGGTTNFNQNISSWNTSAVTLLSGMFGYATSFNQNISSWNTSATTDMQNVFFGASAFNQNIGAWNIANVINMSNIFYNSGINISNYDAILTAWNAAGHINKYLGSASPLIYCAAATARTTLVTPISSGGKGWSISGDVLCAPEINIKGNAISIVTGDITPVIGDHTDFGGVLTTSGTIVRTFTIENLGSLAISLSGSPIVNITGAHAADFTVTTLPSSSVAVLGSTTFQITFDPSVAGVRTATVSIANNDSNENPYTFSIQGFGASTPVNPFITRWNLATAGYGTTQFYFGITTSGPVDYTWQEIGGSGASGVGVLNSALTPLAVFTGLPAGSIIELSISSTNFRRFNMDDSQYDKNRLTEVKQWGGVAWTSMEKAFYNCNNLNVTATDIPNLSGVTSTSYMFYDCDILTGPSNINSWSTATITNMANMFERTYVFNQNISSWNTSAVTNMSFMFRNSTIFNQDLSTWNTGAVTNIYGMFGGAKAFNQNISSWNTSMVTNIGAMFADASSFNQNISSWNTALVTDMRYVFQNASVFNQNIGTWNIANATMMTDMLQGSGINTNNYDAILTAWNTAGYTNKSLGNANPLKYCTSTAARTSLTTAVASGGKGWNITSDGNDCNAEIVLKGNGFVIESNSFTIPNLTNHTNFGSVNVTSGSIVRTFTIENRGAGTLSLSGSPVVKITGAGASDFTVNTLPLTSIAGSGSTTFQITFDPSVAFGRSAIVSVANNDANENPYSFAITGVGTVPISPFITRWNLATAGSGANQLSFAVTTLGSVNYVWQEVGGGGSSGSGTFSGSTAIITGLPTGAIIDLSIDPVNFQRIFISNGTDRSRLIDIKQWGTVSWTNMLNAFSGCNNMTASATDWPNLNGVTDTGQMFSGCSVLNGPLNINTWNMGSITSMVGMFQNALAFNQNLDSWYTASVINMSSLFFGATSFNQNISSWNTTAVTNMSSLFKGASAFNQNIATWNIANTASMVDIFFNSGINTSTYDAMLTTWSTSSFTNKFISSAFPLTYCSASSARTTLTTSIASGGKGWTIGGDASACGPEINIKGNGVNIVSGDITPSITDHTDFGSALFPSGTIIRTFTIDNVGTAALTLSGSPLVSITGANASDFTLTVLPTTPVAISGSTTFQITFAPSAVGTRTATLSIANNDGNENPYTFAIQGIGALADPEINLKGNSVSIVSGDITPSPTDHTDFGSVLASSGTIVRTFMIENLGTAALTLSGSPLVSITGTNASDFILTTVPTTPVSVSGSTTFQITFDPSAVGTRTATLSIANNDANENPYTFAIQGTGTVPVIPFITRWNLVTAGSGATQLTFGITTTGTVNYTWQEVGGGGASSSGTLSGSTATITGLPIGAMIDLSIDPTNFRYFGINNGTDKSRLIDVKQWGSVAWTSMNSSFYGCNNLNITATDIPNLSGVTNMASMFHSCSSLNGPANINSWNTSTITSMGALFYNCSSFNQNVGSWNTAAVTSMSSMFQGTPFNQNISGWNTAVVTQMGAMFYQNSVFNQNISSWNTAAVTSMNYMFGYATAFNQNISTWNTTAVTNMSYMFQGATSFNQNISTWNTAAVTNMNYMFQGATAFNQNIGSWNIANATTMTDIFNNSGINVSNYDAILTAWNTAGYTNKNLGNASPLKYCASAPRTTLTTAIASGGKGWTIISDALNSTCGSGPEPEINLKGNNVSIGSGDITPITTDNTDFGSIDVVSGTIVRTFTIENLGTAALTLSGGPVVSITGANVSDFMLGVDPTTPVAVSASTTFQISFDPSGGGTRTATVSIANNDADENPYTFAIQGTGIDCQSVLTLSSTNVPTDDISNGTIIKQANATTGTIAATNKITGTANVIYRAGKSITLDAGFKADNGVVFKTEFGGCN